MCRTSTLLLSMLSGREGGREGEREGGKGGEVGERESEREFKDSNSLVCHSPHSEPLSIWAVSKREDLRRKVVLLYLPSL